jgi:hypothetical protein
MTHRRLLGVLALWIILPSIPTAALGEEVVAVPLPDKISLSVGGFLVDHVKTEIRVDVKGFPIGTSINLSNDLEVDGSNKVVRLDGYYRFNPRHRIDLNWYRFNRTGNTSIGKDIQLGKDLFTTGSDIDTNLKNNLIKLGYTYSFYHVEEVELGLSLGFHLFDLDINLRADSLNAEESGGALLPLPNLGFRVVYSISPRFQASGTSQFFFIQIGDYRGAMTDFLVALEYRALQNVGVGLGFNRFVLAVDAEDDEFRGSVETIFNGFHLYIVGKL